MRKWLVTGLAASVLMLGVMATSDTDNQATADPLVNVHVHGTNLGRTQIHVHHLVHNVRILDDGTLIFEVEPEILD